MHLAKLTISNFRKMQKAELRFQPDLNVLMGANNVGKTAVIDALRALLAGRDEPGKSTPALRRNSYRPGFYHRGTIADFIDDQGHGSQ